jgi:hypothetical protein
LVNRKRRYFLSAVSFSNRRTPKSYHSHLISKVFFFCRCLLHLLCYYNDRKFPVELTAKGFLQRPENFIFFFFFFCYSTSMRSGFHVGDVSTTGMFWYNRINSPLQHREKGEYRKKVNSFCGEIWPCAGCFFWEFGGETKNKTKNLKPKQTHD